MPAYSHHRYWRKDSIADGATVSDSWTADEAFIIKRLHLQRSDGTGLTASTIYFKVGERVFTRPEAPAVIFGPNVEVSPVLDIPITKGEKLDWTFKNLEGATINVLVTIEVWKP